MIKEKLDTRKFLSKGPVYFREIVQWPSNVPNELADGNARLRLELFAAGALVIVEIDDGHRNTHLVDVVRTEDVEVGSTLNGHHYAIIHSTNGDEILATISVGRLQVRLK